MDERPPARDPPSRTLRFLVIVLVAMLPVSIVAASGRWLLESETADEARKLERTIGVLLKGAVADRISTVVVELRSICDRTYSYLPQEARDDSLPTRDLSHELLRLRRSRRLDVLEVVSLADRVLGSTDPRRVGLRRAHLHGAVTPTCTEPVSPFVRSLNWWEPDAMPMVLYGCSPPETYAAFVGGVSIPRLLPENWKPAHGAHLYLVDSEDRPIGPRPGPDVDLRAHERVPILPWQPDGSAIVVVARNARRERVLRSHSAAVGGVSVGAIGLAALLAGFLARRADGTRTA